MVRPDAREVQRPLLGYEEAAPPSYHAPPRRRIRSFVLILAASLFLVSLLVGATYSTGARLKPIQDRIGGYLNHHSDDEGALEEVAGIEQESREWSKEDRQLRKYAWKTPGPHESLETVLQTLTRVESDTPIFRTRQFTQLSSRHRSKTTQGIGS